MFKLERRRLGRTGYQVSILTIGGCGPGICPDAEMGVKAVQDAIARGLNMLDIAPSYGEAELRLGKLVRENRNKLVITEKTMERSREGAWRELKTSLERLGANYFDAYQFHAVGSLEELDAIFSDNGAMKAFLEAKDMGLIKHIGITAHKDMRVVMEALKRFDFDTILIPVTPISLVHPTPENDFRPLLKIARDRDVGVIAIKAVAKGRWDGEPHHYQTWYHPFDDEESMEVGMRFALSQEGVATYPMACDVRLWPKILKIGESFRRMSDEEQRKAVEYVKARGASPLFPEPAQ
ncbi:oxidoreductase [Sulfodiicoccus acidiphilus]|uniref:Oxidoreductase n=1 Tax=Sulfodiicoccus acidiphilus TaxID=1670455 RepID=A0A830H3N7_9CREN|nr:aldo/keto reductase [Sulfodiicoccus acidiphilus]GGT98118.1 oxidoreductase [Sulfodiicoccus acidiphilus]